MSGERLSTEADVFEGLPPIGTYWTTGTLPTVPNAFHAEAYATCARCGAFVNSEDRHDQWHEAIERISPPGQQS